MKREERSAPGKRPMRSDFKIGSWQVPIRRLVMNIKILQKSGAVRMSRFTGLITCAALLLSGTPLMRTGYGQSGVKPGSEQQAEAQSDESKAVKIPAEQLDALVAPIALYPDNLLAQTLAASTYPLEIIQLRQWLDKNPELIKDQTKLVEAVKK